MRLSCYWVNPIPMTQVSSSSHTRPPLKLSTRLNALGELLSTRFSSTILGLGKPRRFPSPRPSSTGNLTKLGSSYAAVSTFKLVTHLGSDWTGTSLHRLQK